ncbi:MAG: DUF1800 domain-containing protein [Bacteroidia bacterium]|nr:DUF1800 domain-containing protein [Bacteroidia bacterium]
MERKQFFRQAWAALTAPQIRVTDEEPNPWLNRELPPGGRSRSGLEAYSGSWTFAEAAHLLRRTTFGPRMDEIENAVRAGLPATLDQLLAPKPLPDPPVNPSFTNDPAVPIGSTWVYVSRDPNVNGYRRRSLEVWWTGQMLNDGISLTEMMTLFWHNHFVTELGTVLDAHAMYQYLDLLRRHALGNWQRLTEDMTLNPAMLEYLNGNQNTGDAPNENYARELLELFTIGKGPLIGPGDYTWFTEQDIQAAARILTGWRSRYPQQAPFEPAAYFTASRHDMTAKQFSPAFQNRLITTTGDQAYKELISMIFDQEETARFLCRKLYRWFVYYVIDETAEELVINPMADLLRDHNYDIIPALRALLSSAHFYDMVNQGCIIKNPLVFILGAARQLEVVFPADPNPGRRYVMWGYLLEQAATQQMAPLSPPNVAGWPAYYQAPGFHELWINSVTLPARTRYTDQLIGAGYTRNGFTLKIDPLPLLAQYITDPNDPWVLVETFARLMLPQPLVPEQITFLRDTLLPGIPDYEWGMEYGAYLANPQDDNLRMSVLIKLQALFKTLMNLAEYHLC